MLHTFLLTTFMISAGSQGKADPPLVNPAVTLTGIILGTGAWYAWRMLFVHWFGGPLIPEDFFPTMGPIGAGGPFFALIGGGGLTLAWWAAGQWPRYAVLCGACALGVVGLALVVAGVVRARRVGRNASTQSE